MTPSVYRPTPQAHEQPLATGPADIEEETLTVHRRVLHAHKPLHRGFRGKLAKTVIALSAGLAVLGSSGVAQAAAETWTLQTPGDPYSYRKTTSSNGAVNNRFELRSGDQWANDLNKGDGRQRVEMRGRTYQPMKTDIWFSYAFRWDQSMPQSWTTVTQFHQEPEAGEPAGKPPAFHMHISGGKLQLRTRSDARVNTTSQVTAVDRFSLPLFAKNTWQNIVVRVKFDPHGQGRLTFWLNGTQKYDSGPIPIGYNDAIGPYFKHGLYRGASDLTTVADFANVEIGTSSLSDRIANPKPLPN
jgi:hypothetical protein